MDMKTGTTFDTDGACRELSEIRNIFGADPLIVMYIVCGAKWKKRGWVERGGDDWMNRDDCVCV
jgi:hypothetical protein